MNKREWKKIKRLAINKERTWELDEKIGNADKELMELH